MRQRILAGIILSLTAATSNAALLGRVPLTLGGTDYRAYYDTDLNITWLADANFARSSDWDADGHTSWSGAQGLMTHMNSINYLGVNDWRLPEAVDRGSDGCNYAYSGTDCGFNVDTGTGELASLFTELGNLAYYDTQGGGPQPGWGLVNAGPFVGLEAYQYWYGTPYAPDNAVRAWNFDFDSGRQFWEWSDSDGGIPWAVRDGDISVVPIPAAVWLLGSALGALGWAKRKAN